MVKINKQFQILKEKIYNMDEVLDEIIKDGEE